MHQPTCSADGGLIVTVSSDLANLGLPHDRLFCPVIDEA
jgi:hypothetical protein